MKLKVISALILTSALLITGCSGAQDKTQDNNRDNTKVEEGTSTSYPITIKHAYGETVIEKEPTRVATISWGNHDVPLALGVVPVGVSKANYGETDENGLLPWTGEQYKKLGVDKPQVFDDVDGLDYEAISDANPDVILAKIFWYNSGGVRYAKSNCPCSSVSKSSMANILAGPNNNKRNSNG